MASVRRVQVYTLHPCSQEGFCHRYHGPAQKSV